ncbi:M48 family metallopeptidase [Candidatus Peregrinibacteria bacterium]|nr:M48 family metallopeptidase [Candidatus Peregrinibacteria bacterium]
MIKRTLVYILQKSSRARRLRIEITPDAQVKVTLPRFLSEKTAENFVREKAKWILRKIREIASTPPIIPHTLKGARREYLESKSRAKKLVREKLIRFNRIYNFSFRKIAIRNQGSRWGSCSKKANLNFNYKIIFLPENLADYLIVHELCHLKEMNHSKKFWELVAKTVPEYKTFRKQLKKMKI